MARQDNTTGTSEPMILDLWPGKVPGDVGIDGEENVRNYDSPLVGRTRVTTNVSVPRLVVYLPTEEQNTGTAVVICPGGGYHDLFLDLEGYEVAEWLTSKGIAGIILKYRCPRRPGDKKGIPPLGPQIDAQRAISTVRARADEWKIDPGRIGIMGFSAGGHLALAAATGFHARKYEAIDQIDAASCRPDFAVGGYSGYLKRRDHDMIPDWLSLAEDTSPVFLTHSGDDSVSDVANSVIAYLALQRFGVPAELHVFATGEHDFGVRQNDKLPSSWPELLLKWLRSLNLLSGE